MQITLRKPVLKGSMAFEGALAVPLFLFFMASLLYSLEIVRFQSDAWEAMHQTGSRICAASRIERAVDEEIRSGLREETAPFLCVENEEKGVAASARILGSGQVEVQVSYRIRPFIFFLPIGEILVEDYFYGHDWQGYREAESGGGQEAEPYVYITETGEKYHISGNCTYLKVSVEAVMAKELVRLRNEAGEIYRSCERCRPAEQGLVYLTKWGNRFHGKSDCPAFARKVHMVPLSQAGGRTACRKCG